MELAETTVKARLAALVQSGGLPSWCANVPGSLLKQAGARAAVRYRTERQAEPPRVQELHPALGGWIGVFAYPGATEYVDEALLAVIGFEYGYRAPPPPDTSIGGTL